MAMQLALALIAGCPVSPRILVNGRTFPTI
jgi:hypothetical protein